MNGLATSTRSLASRSGQTALLISCIALCFTPALAGWAFPPDAWYQALRKPSWNPPNWLFGPVWTALYLAMGFALYRIARQPSSSARRAALVAFAAQLLLNAAWTPIFFGARSPGWAFAVIVLLDLLIVVTAARFSKLDRFAGRLLLPYLAWCLFATALNGTLWWLNPS